jgi:hypothetical protein
MTLEEKAKNLHEKLSKNQQVEKLFVMTPFQFGTFCSLIYKDAIDEKANKIVIFADEMNYQIILYNCKSQILSSHSVENIFNISTLLIFLYQSQPSFSF